MKNVLITLLGFVVAASVAPSWAEPLPPDMEKVPTERLITNLEKRVRDAPKDLEAHYALARVHAIAYALQGDEVWVGKRRQPGKPFFRNWDYEVDYPLGVQPPSDEEKKKLAQEHLKIAIRQYDLATRLDENRWPSQLGLAWCLEQSGDKKSALRHYRKALDLVWAGEKNEYGPSVIPTSEIAGYMLKLLDSKKDAAEIRKIESYIAKAKEAQKHRPVTPIIIPLVAHAEFRELINPTARVAFDLDGSGLPRKWGWITPKAGWLVFDHDGRGEITSGLQMFGNVTFWIFWKNGYHALAALDADGDGELRGDELRGLAIWRDANSNGVSESGEVLPLSAYGIVALSTRYEIQATGMPYNQRGVIFRDGSARATYDWIVKGK